MILTLEVWRTVGIVAGQIVAVLVVTGLLGWLLRILFKTIESRMENASAAKGLSTARRLTRNLLRLVGGTLFLLILGGNGYLIAQGGDLLAFYRDQLAQIGPDFWMGLGLGILYSALAVGVTLWLIRLLSRLLAALKARAMDYEQIHTNDESIEVFFAGLNRIQRNGLWLAVGGLIAGFLGLPEVAGDVIFTALRIYLIISLGLLVVSAVAVVVTTLETLSQRYYRTDTLLYYYNELKGLIPLLRRSLEYIVYIFVATLVLLQVTFVAQFAEWGPRLVQIIGIFFLSRVAIEVVNLLVDRALGQPAPDAPPEENQRRLTLSPLIKSLLKYLVYSGAFVLVLQIIELDVTPILAGAGLLTLIVGLGAQPIINDVVSGFFILFENLFLVGDYIEIGTAQGVVEAIDIRTTRIRDPDGQQHILRNGQMGEVINFSKGYTYAVVTVGVAYDSDLEKVYRVLAETGVRFAASHPDVLVPTEVAGLEDFGESDLVVRTITRVKPGRHLQISRDLRAEIKRAFDQNGIEIPFPQRVLHFPAGLGTRE
jgi:small-conductance mechanosensitive channel